jgi:hypothetical protein
MDVVTEKLRALQKVRTESSLSPRLRRPDGNVADVGHRMGRKHWPPHGPHCASTRSAVGIGNVRRVCRTRRAGHPLATRDAAATTTKWLSVGIVAAVRSGAFSLSSHRVDPTGACGGVGWIIDPYGNILARTTAEALFATVDIDLSSSAAARAGYPGSARGPKTFL